MVGSSLHRNSSDLTVQLLETELLPSHTSPNDPTSPPPNAGLLVIKTHQGYQRSLPLKLTKHSEIHIKANSILTVGRSRSSSIVVSHPTASLRHLIIYSVMIPPDCSDSLIFCQDLNSMNGTFCNNRRLRDNEPVLLNHGDCIQLRHAAKIYLVQPNVEREDVEELLGAGGDVKRIEKNFRISNRLVGQGGMAKIFLAQNRVSRQYVACKIIHIDTAKPKSVVHAKNEIDILSNLSHPNIITMFSSIETPTSIMIFEPLLCGGDLHNFIFYMHTEGLDEFAAKFIIYQILLAVAYLHSHGIAHRDLKLENILLQRPMNPVVITLTDFGLARKDVCPTKRMNTFCGSLDFLAPEVVKMSPFLKSRTKKQGYGKEVDIWAIGVIAYSIMSGEFPFVDERPMQLLQSIVNDGVFFSSAWITKSKLAERFVRWMLRKDAELRPTATEALSHPFITSSAAELKILYDEMVMVPSAASGKAAVVVPDKDAEDEGLVWEGDTLVENDIQDALAEIDANMLESRERKRQYMDGKENDFQDTGDEGQLMKKRKFDAD